MTGELKIFGICGSLREKSYNSATLRAARDLAPQGTKFDIFDRLEEIPPFNEDAEGNPADAVVDLKRRIARADAVVIATPEYNYSVPGVLKNAIDWASRPYGDNSWAGKPVAVMGASIGMLGSARAQYHLRQTFVFLDMHPVNQPEVMIPMAADRFDDHGELTDDASKRFIGELMENLAAWAKRLKSTERELVRV
jgi:chromate reductase, NAD(P)H dehydrogenase (quinone)